MIKVKAKQFDANFNDVGDCPPTTEDLAVHKAALEGYCLYPNRNPENVLGMTTTARTLMFMLKFYTDALMDSWKAEKKQEFDGQQPDENGLREISLSIDEPPRTDDYTALLEMLINQIFDKLFFLTITPTADKYNPEETDRYEEKVCQIKEVTEDIAGSIVEILEKKFYVNCGGCAF